MALTFNQGHRGLGKKTEKFSSVFMKLGMAFKLVGMMNFLFSFFLLSRSIFIQRGELCSGDFFENRKRWLISEDLFGRFVKSLSNFVR